MDNRFSNLKGRTLAKGSMMPNGDGSKGDDDDEEEEDEGDGEVEGLIDEKYQKEIQTPDYDFLEYDVHNSEVKEFPDLGNQGVGNLDSSGDEHQETEGVEKTEECGSTSTTDRVQVPRTTNS
ncbi:hypothetical protein F0562_007917 [Nyssa sinensis]|uniref:Uncharacterized protein n=1 Tax=Nyssa sinensis TaxID=561372 RepID=A0A5J5A516_9ASTE|nr:hypothetical protein F0562_007917 [Nyssa sinensis]